MHPSPLASSSSSFSLSLSHFLPFHDIVPTIGDEIENIQDLIQAVKDVGDWRALCTNLKINEGKMDFLVNSADSFMIKKAECLQAYFDEGDAKWSDVVKAVAKHPVNKIRIAKKIAKIHGINFDEVIKHEL